MSPEEEMFTTQDDIYSDEDINELSEWLEDLTLKQIFFLKESYEIMLKQFAMECGSQYVN